MFSVSFGLFCLLNIIAAGKIPKKDPLCNKTYFLNNFVKNQQVITDSEYKQLTQCNITDNMCKDFPGGSFTVTFAEDQQQRYLVVIDATGLINQGCWAYSIHVKDDKSISTEYFNIGGSTKDHTMYHYIKFNINYEFRLTPLPSGQPMIIRTKSPRISKKELFSQCGSPGYNERLAISGTVCKMYPNDISKRASFANKRIIENNCRFEISPNNAV